MMTASRCALAAKLGKEVDSPSARRIKKMIRKKQLQEDIEIYGFVLDTEDVHNVGRLPSCKATFESSSMGTYHLIITDACKEVLNSGKVRRASVDATFCFKKKGWQVLTIWGSEYDEANPQRHEQLLAVALMNAKSEQLYDHVFSAVRGVCPRFQPDYFTCDFEHALRNSFLNKIGGTFWGCIFHFMQAIRRKLSSLKLDPELHEVIENAMGRLAFSSTKAKFQIRLTRLRIMLGDEVSMEDHMQMRRGSTIVATALTNFFPSQAQDIMAFRDYFRKEWLEGHTAVSEDWAFHRRIDDGTEDIAISTNNHAESGHARMKNSRKKLTRDSNVFRWIEWLVGFLMLSDYTSRSNNYQKDYDEHSRAPRTAQARAIKEKQRTYPDFVDWMGSTYNIAPGDWPRLSVGDQKEILGKWGAHRGWREPQNEQTSDDPNTASPMEDTNASLIGSKRKQTSNAEDSDLVPFGDWFVQCWQRTLIHNSANGDCGIESVVMSPETYFNSTRREGFEECHAISRDWLRGNMDEWSRYFMGNPAEVEAKQQQYIQVYEQSSTRVHQY